MNKMLLTLVGISSLIFSLGLQAHEHQVKPKLAGAKSAATSGPVISGGYQYIPGRLALPTEVDIKHAHGLARDKEDNIYLAYESNTIDKDTRAIAQFDNQGKFVRYIGDASFAEGVPHGLDWVSENGKGYLYLSNNDQTVRKINMQGEVVWQVSKKPDDPAYKEGAYRPTDTALIPSSNQLFVADGYGSSRVMEMNPTNGDFGKITLSGEQSGKHFNTPHGITFDPRTSNIVVSDREHYRLVYFDKDGKFLHSVAKGQGVSRVVNVDVLQDELLVSNLDGTVAYLDENNELIEVIKLDEALGDKGHKYPHDAIFMSNGDIVIGTWNPGLLSYWKKLK